MHEIRNQAAVVIRFSRNVLSEDSKIVWHANLASWEACFSLDIQLNLHEKI